MTDKAPATYAGAGVDIEAGDKAVSLIRDAVRSTYRPEVVGDIGGFGGLFALRTADHDQPVLVSSTDGVGTKAIVAAAARRYGTIGIDLVAMCVDDIVCQGAEPLFLLDYLAVGKLDPEMTAEIVDGVAEGCRRAGCALLGGEMAEHPGAMGPGEFDLSGFSVGVVERAEILGPDRVRSGNRLVGLASPGLRCNGYALARQVVQDHDVLLEPSVIYAPSVLAVKKELGPALHAAAHITGGGLVGNVPRVLPSDCDAVLDGGAWEVPEVFRRIRRAGVDPGEMSHVFNLGLGMVLVVAPGREQRAVEVLGAAGCPATIVGEVVAGNQGVRIEGLAL